MPLPHDKEEFKLKKQFHLGKMLAVVVMFLNTETYPSWGKLGYPGATERVLVLLNPS